MVQRKSFHASRQDRSVAYIADLAATAVICIAVFAISIAVGADISNVFCFGAVLAAYQTYCHTRNPAQSFGKFLRNIAVVGADGSALNPPQAILRSVSLGLPYMMLGLEDAFPEIQSEILAYGMLAGPFIGVAWLLVDIILMEFSPTGRTLTDLLARTAVVNLPPLQPHRAPAVPMFSATDAEFGNPPRRK